MKSSVFPTPKRGGLTGQSETASYVALLGGIHSLVPRLATLFEDYETYRDYLSTLVVSSSHEAYMCWHKLIASLSVLCSTSFSLHLLEFTQTLWKLASSYEVYLTLWITVNPLIYLMKYEI